MRSDTRKLEHRYRSRPCSVCSRLTEARSGICHPCKGELRRQREAPKPKEPKRRPIFAIDVQRECEHIFVARLKDTRSMAPRGWCHACSALVEFDGERWNVRRETWSEVESNLTESAGFKGPNASGEGLRARLARGRRERADAIWAARGGECKNGHPPSEICERRGKRKSGRSEIRRYCNACRREQYATAKEGRRKCQA